MKRKLLLIMTLVAACMLLVPVGADAQSRAKKNDKKWAKNKLDLYQIHNLSMWGGVGYSGLVNNYNNNGTSRFIGGGGGMIGVGYEWHYKKFMLSVGPEFRLLSSKDKIPFAGEPDHPFSIAGTDPASTVVLPGQTKYYEFSRFRETQIVGQIMLPIMAGAQFEDLDFPLYFLAGAKIGYTIAHSYVQRGNLTTSIHDPAAYDPSWVDVRDLKTAPFVSRGKNGMGLDVAISAEFGVNINPYLDPRWNKDNEKRKYPWHMRAAVFLDYGLPLTNLGTAANMVSVTETEAQTISLHTSKYATSPLNSLLVGAKFTALLQLNRPKQRKPQNPYMVLQLINGRTGQPLTGQDAKASVIVTNVASGRVMKKGAANGKGMFIQRFKPDMYEVAISKEGFLPIEPFKHELIEEQNNNLKKALDTTKVILYPEPVFACRVINIKTGEAIAAHVSVVDTTASRVVKEFDVSRSGGSTKLPIGDTYYNALVEAKGFYNQMFTVGVQTMDDINLEFALEPIKKRTYIIKNLFFASDKTDILPQSEPAMQELFEFLDKNPEVRIRITGHTDWIGTDKDNQILSEGRANSVKRSMVERGINPDRIETEGKGESQPVDTNETEEGRQNNRRVEFTILEGATDNVEYGK